MARKKKEGRRDRGIQAKKGMLYIVISQRVLKNGESTFSKKWISTGLTDTSENVQKAVAMRKAMLSSSDSALSTDRDVMFEEYLNLFLAKKKRDVSDTTYSGYRNRGLRIKKYFGSRKLRNITGRDVNQFLDYLITERGNQERTVKDTKVLFRDVMDHAVKDGLIPGNPVSEATISKALLTKNAREKSDDDFFSYHEAVEFLEIVESHVLYELFYVVLFFGLRREEVLGLRWSCIDFRTKSFSINHTVTKGTSVNRVNATKTAHSARKYPLTDEQVNLFKRLKSKEDKYRQLFGRAYNDNEYVFKHEDGKLFYPDYPSKAFGKIIRKHPELPQDITFHGLRSSCVSILVHQGFDVKAIQKWVGHADINTTLKIYARVKEKEAKQEILDGMNQIIHIKKYDD